MMIKEVFETFLAYFVLYGSGILALGSFIACAY
jgi:hypothetical protein